MGMFKSEVEIGWLPTLELDLIPVLKIELDPPSQQVIDAFKTSTSSRVEVPVSGKCPGVIDGLKCELIWKRKTDKGVEDGRCVSAQFKKIADGTFKVVDSDGKDPVVDILNDKLVGKGVLGYSIKPLLPYNKAAEDFPDGLSYDNDIGIDTAELSSVKIGQKVELNLIKKGFFEHCDVRLLINENDEGEMENKNAVGIQHTWVKGDDEVWMWTVGFADTGYSSITYPEPNETGTYEYSFTLLAKDNKMVRYAEVRRMVNVVKDIKKPELTEFALEYKENTLIDDLFAKGKIANLAPETQLWIGVKVTTRNQPENGSRTFVNEEMCKCITDARGEFKVKVDWNWTWETFDLKEHMAILYPLQLYAKNNIDVENKMFAAPISWMMEYDESTFSAFNGSEVVPKSEGRFLCSVNVGGNSMYDFEKELAKFPDTYHEKLKALHSKRSKWEFYAHKCNFSFNEFIDKEMTDGVVCTSITAQGYNPPKTIRPDGGNYDPGWFGASKSAVRYYVDPRNFIDESLIFQFLSTRYSESTQKEVYVRTVLGGALTGKESVFVKAGGTKINAIFLAAKSMVETGKGTSSLATGSVSGYSGFFNMYGIGATDGNAATAGAKTAEAEGWNSVDKAIIGGGEWIYKHYIEKHNQDTPYTLKWNVAQYAKNKTVAHQYATSIYSAKVKAEKFGEALKDMNAPFVFSIPVFNDMPEKCPKPKIAQNI